MLIMRKRVPIARYDLYNMHQPMRDVLRKFNELPIMYSWNIFIGKHLPTLY